MADPEISRLLPAITRRKLLYSPTALVVAAGVSSLAAAARVLPTAAVSPDQDPVLHLFGEWQAAHALYLHLSDLRWDAEVELFRRAKFPEVEIHLPDDKTFSAVTEEEITLGLALPGMKKVRAMARADLAAMTARWEEMDNEIGYSRALDAESRAAERRLAVSRFLLATPCNSVAGASSKLTCFIEMNTPVAHYRKRLNPALRDFITPSFPDLRAILAELVSFGGGPHGPVRA